jgi:type IV secretion system protein VirD4
MIMATDLPTRASPFWTPKRIRQRKPAKMNKDAKGGLVVGHEKRGKAEMIYYLGDDVHSLTIGATRSGKSRCIVLQSIAYTALAGESMVVNDPKGELAAYCPPY